jgi:hypothetical protein
LFFYSRRAFVAFGRATLPGAEFSFEPFRTPVSTMVPPVFSLPWLQIPAALYPMDANLYRWRF